MPGRGIRAGEMFLCEEWGEMCSCKQQRQERAAAEMKGGETKKNSISGSDSEPLKSV